MAKTTQYKIDDTSSQLKSADCTDNDALRLIKTVSETRNLNHVNKIVLAGAGAKNVNVKIEALVTAVNNRHVKCVKQLIQLGADVNQITHEGMSVLCEASRNGDAEVVKLILKAGAFVNKQVDNGTTALQMACFRGHDETITVLLEAGTDVNITDDHNETPLLSVSWSGFAQCMKILLDAGADVNAVGVSEETALHRTAYNVYLACIQMLLETGVDVNISNDDGNTALIKAAQQDNVECVNSLIKAGANVNWMNHAGETALIKTVLEGNVTCADALIKAGADVNFTDVHYNTPLMATAGRGRYTLLLQKGRLKGSNILEQGIVRIYKCILLLLQAGAHVNVINAQGQNALPYCVANFKEWGKNIVMLLYAAGESTGTVANEGNQIEIPNYLNYKELRLCLKHLAREAIRKHLISVNPQAHLFHRIPLLGLPSSLTEYSLYGCSLYPV